MSLIYIEDQKGVVMGAFQGGLTYRQYRVNQHLPPQWQKKIQQGLTTHLAKEINPAGDDDRSIGWCNAHFALDTSISLEQCLYNEYIVVGMRIDTLVVPKSLLVVYCEREERKAMQELKKDVLSRYEKAEIRERVEAVLRKKVLPNIKTAEIVWNWETGYIRFFNTSKALNEEFVELFEESFGMTLTPEYAYTLAQDPMLGLSAPLLKTLDKVEPTAFVDQETLIETLRG